MSTRRLAEAIREQVRREAKKAADADKAKLPEIEVKPTEKKDLPPPPPAEDGPKVYRRFWP